MSCVLLSRRSNAVKNMKSEKVPKGGGGWEYICVHMHKHGYVYMCTGIHC